MPADSAYQPGTTLPFSKNSSTQAWQLCKKKCSDLCLGFTAGCCARTEWLCGQAGKLHSKESASVSRHLGWTAERVFTAVSGRQRSLSRPLSHRGAPQHGCKSRRRPAVSRQPAGAHPWSTPAEPTSQRQPGFWPLDLQTRFPIPKRPVNCQLVVLTAGSNYYDY